MLDSNTIPIRTAAAIDAEIADLELSLQGNAAADDDVATRIDSDQFDGGIIREAAKPRDPRTGHYRNAESEHWAGEQLASARKLRAEYRAERREIRHRIAELKAERQLWSDRTPLGMVEIAAMLGYSAIAARQWKRRNVLPTPAGTVSGTPYWWRGDVLGWALERGRTRAIVDLDIPESDWDSGPTR